MPDIATYTGKDIQVLEGLEPVRKRPGMYIGGTGKPGLHHLLWEVVDNAVDEATNGYATTIEVTLHADGESVTVCDNGRGIPVDKHPTKKIPTLVLILTTLHTGGKFDQTNYITSGGLHGVGASVVNALSSEMVATIKRDGRTYEQRYERGTPVTKLKVISKNSRGSGTTVFFRPDEEIFEDTTFDVEQIKSVLDVKTYLNRQLRIVLVDAARDERFEYHHEGGIEEYLDVLAEEQKARSVHDEVFLIEDNHANGQGRVELALRWTESPRELVRSFVNGIPTQDGGTHEQGFRSAVRSAVLAYMETHDLLPRSLEISSDDIREGLFAIVNLFMSDPQFQGQTKDKLNNPEARGLVSSALRLELEHYLNTHPTTGEAIATRVIQAARARQASRAAARQSRKSTKVSHRLNLPGKLADCSSTDPGESELFIVEGDSAGGSAKQGRDRKHQAVLPLRGKVLNAEQASLSKVQNNKELSNVVDALGCGLQNHLNIEHLRYGKVILLMDADSDGHHIATLLLTFFYRYMRPLIDEGHVYLAQPPLYRLVSGQDTYWALDDLHKDHIMEEIKAKRKNANVDIQRFKGLGEMMPATLKETTLDPDSRHLLRVNIRDEEKFVTEKTVSELMGKDTSARFDFIMEHAGEVEELDV